MVFLDAHLEYVQAIKHLEYVDDVFEMGVEVGAVGAEVDGVKLNVCF